MDTLLPRETLCDSGDPAQDIQPETVKKILFTPAAYARDILRRMARATLRVAGGPGSGQSFDITAALEIGRGLPGSPDLGDPTISRHHARLDLDATGRLTIEDLGSHHGTRVNGRLTTGAEPVVVGDVVDLGDTTLEITAVETADVAVAGQETKVRVTPERDKAQQRAATRSRSIAAGLPVLPVRSIVTSVRIRAALATAAVVVLLWLVLYIRESNGDDPGLAKKTASVAPATSTQTTAPATAAQTTTTVSSTTSTTTTKTS
jgi:pSer/pThr/pTyr-binding forkhead associated (FHA) protein